MREAYILFFTVSIVKTWKRGKNDELNKIMRIVLFGRNFAVLKKHEQD